ncbi:hypothetical protein, partial [Pseudomonas nunensis]|uniref:hypothetical protein n=1 Tax=Pseudomonas nunensis TaxID=2961896 RepID=UPI0025B09B52
AQLLAHLSVSLVKRGLQRFSGEDPGANCATSCAVDRQLNRQEMPATRQLGWHFAAQLLQ